MPNSLPTPATITANTNPTAASFNTYRDALQQLQGASPTGGQGPLDFFTAVQATAQTGLTSGVFVPITFATTSEIVDSAGGHDPSSNSSRYVGKLPGYYEVSGCVAFAGSASGTRRVANLLLNGTTAVPGSAGSNPPMSTNSVIAVVPVCLVYLNGTTDYVEIQGLADYASWATVVTAASGTASRLTARWVHT